MRMRPWLEKMIDSNSISGLNWVDKVRLQSFEFTMIYFNATGLYIFKCRLFYHERSAGGDIFLQLFARYSRKCHVAVLQRRNMLKWKFGTRTYVQTKIKNLVCLNLAGNTLCSAKVQVGHYLTCTNYFLVSVYLFGFGKLATQIKCLDKKNETCLTVAYEY